MGDPSAQQRPPSWKSPAAWLRSQKLGRDFWIFFMAAFFFDFGFSVYHFLFNLFLLDFHFNERSIGIIGSAGIIGGLLGTLPVGMLAKKYGVRPLLLVGFTASPIVGVLSVFFMSEEAQIGLSFAFGLCMCLWGVCFLPAIARTTTDENRQMGFSFITSAAIATAMLGGVLCGYLPKWLLKAGYAMQPVDIKRLLLIASCGIAALGIFAVLKMRLHLAQEEEQENEADKRWWTIDPFLLRFIPAMALWTFVLTSFNPFANVYLSKNLHVPFTEIGFIFSTGQVVQLLTGLITPFMLRALGMINSLTAAQMATALTLGWLAVTHNPHLAVALYIALAGLQWMASPVLLNLLMTRIPDKKRSTAAAAMNFCNGLVSAGATAGTGALFAKFGYPPVLFGIAVVAVLATLLLRVLVGKSHNPIPVTTIAL